MAARNPDDHLVARSDAAAGSGKRFGAKHLVRPVHWSLRGVQPDAVVVELAARLVNRALDSIERVPMVVMMRLGNARCSDAPLLARPTPRTTS